LLQLESIGDSEARCDLAMFNEGSQKEAVLESFRGIVGRG
jgi:hypothetical protein